MAPSDPPRLLILGCGDLGRAVLASPIEVARPIVATTTTEEHIATLGTLGAEAVRLRIDESARLRELVARVEVVLFSLAPRHGATYAETYLEGARALVAASRGAAVRQVIFTSSSAVYGQDDGSSVDEESLTEPSDDNGRTLLAAEGVLIDGLRPAGVVVTVLRLSGLWAADRGPGRMLGRMAGAERQGGDAWLNLVHRDDVVSAISLVVGRPYDGVLNLNGDTPVRRRDYYDPLCVAAGLPPPRWLAGGGLGKRLDNRRAKNVLGWRPKAR